MGSRLDEFMKHPWVVGVVGVLVAATGAVDVITPLLDEIKTNDADVGAHHGVTLYGIYLALKALGEVIKGKREVEEGVRRVREARGGEARVVGE